MLKPVFFGVDALLGAQAQAGRPADWAWLTMEKKAGQENDNTNIALYQTELDFFFSFS